MRQFNATVDNCYQTLTERDRWETGLFMSPAGQGCSAPWVVIMIVS